MGRVRGLKPRQLGRGAIKPRFGPHPAKRELHGLGLDSAVNNVLCTERVPVGILGGAIVGAKQKEVSV